MLEINKLDILKIANDNNLRWNEDSTNSSLIYSRNLIRRLITSSSMGLIDSKLDNLKPVLHELDRELEIVLKSISSNTYKNFKFCIDLEKFNNLNNLEIKKQIIVKFIRQQDRYIQLSNSVIDQLIAMCSQTESDYKKIKIKARQIKPNLILRLKSFRNKRYLVLAKK